MASEVVADIPNKPEPKPEEDEFHNALRVVYSTLCIGSTYAEQHEFLLLMNQASVSEHAFYDAEERVKTAIRNLLTKKLHLLQNSKALSSARRILRYHRAAKSCLPCTDLLP